MAFKIRKTEHAGAKHGKGAWEKKSIAKHQSSRIRRHVSAAILRSEIG